MHTARAQLFDLMDANELRAEIPMVVARANATLHRDDPRRTSVEELEARIQGWGSLYNDRSHDGLPFNSPALGRIIEMSKRLGQAPGGPGEQGCHGHREDQRYPGRRRDGLPRFPARRHPALGGRPEGLHRDLHP